MNFSAKELDECQHERKESNEREYPTEDPDKYSQIHNTTLSHAWEVGLPLSPSIGTAFEIDQERKANPQKYQSNQNGAEERSPHRETPSSYVTPRFTQAQLDNQLAEMNHLLSNGD
ncbi:hypothetical protein GCM10022254_43430 [Actinomadura meridiana]|uniref:Uncharacterized protein n=1 Tax=Actinomadura meridiana TaxID=559626 RepID=A0ABP8C8Q6_9ACTN